MRKVIYSLLFLCLPSIISATNYYIATWGDDTWNGTEVDSPWVTINQGMDSVSAGDSILIDSGTYTQSVTLVTAGTAANRIVCKSCNGNVILDGVDSSAIVLSLSKGYYNWLGPFEIKNGTYGTYSSNLDAYSHYYDFNIHHNSIRGGYKSKITSWYRSSFSHNGQDGCHGFNTVSMYRCKIDSNGQEGFDVIPACKIYESQIIGNGSHGIYYTQGTLIIGNEICNNGGDGIYRPATTLYNLGMGISNNTIYGNAGDGIDIAEVPPTLNNNIITNNAGYGIKFAAGLPQDYNDYNCVWACTTGNYSNCSAGDSSISVDPLFTDAANGDFTLQTSSPCIDKSEPLFDNRGRDMGACELGQQGSGGARKTDGILKPLL